MLTNPFLKESILNYLFCFAVNRAIVNPNCGSSFTGSSSTFSITDYVELRGINYYAIKPNYFQRGDGTRNLKFTENSYGTVQLCISRTLTKPSNSTSTDICQIIRSNVHTTDISSYCTGSVAECAPIFLSVEGMSTNIKCRGKSIDRILYSLKFYKLLIHFYIILSI